MSFNLATILREPRREHPDKPLCHLGDLTFTYAQVDDMSGRVAAALLRSGCAGATRWPSNCPTCRSSSSPTSRSSRRAW